MNEPFEPQHPATQPGCELTWAPPLLQELRTPTKNRMVSEKQSPIHGVVMGATQRSYLMRDNQVGPRRRLPVRGRGMAWCCMPD